MTRPRKKDQAWERYLKAKGINLATADLPIYLDMKELGDLSQFEVRYLMSMDTRSMCPPIFREHNAFPLALSKEMFAIVHGDAWYDFPEVESATSTFEAYLPHTLLSVDLAGGESAHIMRLKTSGYLRDFIGEALEPIYQGRTTTDSFDVRIANVPLRVKNPQIDYDMLYEGDTAIVPVEGKSRHYGSCSIRQVYYPWRCIGDHVRWKKNIRSLFITFDKKTDDYIIRELGFKHKDVWESLFVRRAERTRINLLSPEEKIIDLNLEPLGDRVPQADKVWRIDELPFLVRAGISHKIAWAEYYGLNARQADYYKDAGRILGLIEAQPRKPWRLTDDGRSYVQMPETERAKELARRMSRILIVREALLALEKRGHIGIKNQDLPDLVIRYAKRERQRVGGTTVSRRTQTLAAWLMYIGMQTGTITNLGGRFYLRGETPNLDKFLELE